MRVSASVMIVWLVLGGLLGGWGLTYFGHTYSSEVWRTGIARVQECHRMRLEPGHWRCTASITWTDGEVPKDREGSDGTTIISDHELRGQVPVREHPRVGMKSAAPVVLSAGVPTRGAFTHALVAMLAVACLGICVSIASFWVTVLVLGRGSRGLQPAH